MLLEVFERHTNVEGGSRSFHRDERRTSNGKKSPIFNIGLNSDDQNDYETALELRITQGERLIGPFSESSHLTAKLWCDFSRPAVRYVLHSPVKQDLLRLQNSCGSYKTLSRAVKAQDLLIFLSQLLGCMRHLGTVV